MKKIIFSIFIAIIAISCESPTLENSVENPETFTTVELQNLQKDTVIMSIQDENIYVFNDKNLVEYRAHLQNDYSASITVDLLIFFLFVFFLLGLIAGIVLDL